jgi:hypothetical protein
MDQISYASMDIIIIINEYGDSSNEFSIINFRNIMGVLEAD